MFNLFALWDSTCAKCSPYSHFHLFFLVDLLHDEGHGVEVYDACDELEYLDDWVKEIFYCQWLPEERVYHNHIHIARSWLQQFCKLIV